MGKARKQELISQREYARRRGISHVAVHKAVAAGRISTVDGKINPAMADREWISNTDQSKPRNSVTGDPKHTRPEGEPPLPMDLGGTHESASGDGAASGYARARAARELYQAQLAKIELDRLRGELVRADEVRIGAANMARKARDQLVAMPERLATILAGIEDASEIHRMLEEEIERICNELSDSERS